MVYNVYFSEQIYIFFGNIFVGALA